jgi:hypothetical protein
MIDTSGAIGYESPRVRMGTWMQLYRTGLAGAKFYIRPLFSHTSGGPMPGGGEFTAR